MWLSSFLARIRSLRRLGRLAHEESGQALIVVVALLILLALAAGLFIAMITARTAQSARQADLIVLRQISEAGLRYADDALTNGPDGADWRPDPASPSASRSYSYGQGRFTLTVSYDPETTEDSPFWNCIRVESVADFGLDQANLPMNPFLKWREIGYKRIALADYARFVTNKDRLGTPAELGVPLLVQYDPGQPESAYTSIFDGSLRVNGDVAWYGSNQLLLTATALGPAHRDDQVEVAGFIRHPSDATYPCSVQVSYNGGAPQAAQPSEPLASFTTLPNNGKPRYLDGAQTVDLADQPRWARYLPPPRLSRQRYLRLTRDTGEWRTSADGLRRYNTGWYGYGEGIYLGNSAHIQSHDYETMRANWLGNTTADWDATQQVYAPPAVQLVLNDSDTNGDGATDITMTWHGDDPGEFKNQDGEGIGRDLVLPYPANGVIYAEGNLAVRGALPADHRLTIVSEGNIYLAGSLEDNTNAKVALLARDSVVLNTTVCAGFLYPVEAHPVLPANYSGALPLPYQVSPSEPFEAVCYWPTALANPRLYLLHSGAANENLPPGPAGHTLLNLRVNGTLFDWGSGTDYEFFKLPPTATPPNESNAVAPQYEGLPDANHTMAITLNVGSWNTIRFETPSTTVNNYWLYRAAIQPLDVEVDALIYAENGSWFVIPGSFFNPYPAGQVPEWYPAGFPGPGEPLDVKITVKGAIAENRAASIGDVVRWTSRWRGADEQWNPATGTSSRGLTYQYDPALRTDIGGLPLLPKLPVSPEFIVWKRQQ